MRQIVSFSLFGLPTYITWTAKALNRLCRCLDRHKSSLSENSSKSTDIMCTTYGECRLISIRRQKECVDSKLVISCRMMHNFLSKYKMWFKSFKHFHELQMYARTDSHRDHSNSAHLWVVEFFSSLCSLSRRNQYTFITIKTQKISKETNRKNNNKIV